MKKRTVVDRLRARVWIEGIRADTGMNFNQMDRLFSPQTRVRQSTLKPIQNGRFAKMFREGILPDSGVSRNSAHGLVHEADRITKKTLSDRLFLPIWNLLLQYSEADIGNWPIFLEESQDVRLTFFEALPTPLRNKFGALLTLATNEEGVSSHDLNDFWGEATRSPSGSIDQLTLLILMSAERDLASEYSVEMWQKAIVEITLAMRADPVFGPHTDELLAFFLKI